MYNRSYTHSSVEIVVCNGGDDINSNDTVSFKNIVIEIIKTMTAAILSDMETNN